MYCVLLYHISSGFSYAGSSWGHTLTNEVWRCLYLHLHVQKSRADNPICAFKEDLRESTNVRMVIWTFLLLVTSPGHLQLQICTDQCHFIQRRCPQIKEEMIVSTATMTPFYFLKIRKQPTFRIVQQISRTKWQNTYIAYSQLRDMAFGLLFCFLAGGTYSDRWESPLLKPEFIISNCKCDILWVSRVAFFFPLQFTLPSVLSLSCGQLLQRLWQREKGHSWKFLLLPEHGYCLLCEGRLSL